jgi:glycosyltransferase involved in cell wall biosynthesis
MPKVLRIINRFNLGGPTYNAAYLTRYLQPEFETRLVGGIHDDSEESSQFILEGLGLSYTLIPEMKRAINPSDVKAYHKISRIIRDFRPDIVHTHAAKAGALGRMAAIRNKVPVIIHTFHGHVLESYFSPVKNKIFIAIERHLARHSTAIIALSQSQKEDLSRILHINDPGKIKIVPLGFDLSRFRVGQSDKRRQFREKYDIREDELAIGIVGRLVPIKNHELFLTSLRHLQQHSGKKIRAFIIGDGEDRLKLEKMARDLGILFSNSYVEGNNTLLTFTSWIKEMDLVMAGLDIITLTSLNEGTPVSLIEAQAAGLPIVSTRVGGIEDVVLPGQTALLSELGDTESFCNNLVNMVNNDELRQKFSLNGWDHVKDKYHYSRLTEDIRRIYIESLSI